MAHRVAWEEIRGPIPEGMCVCHKCDNPRCFNVSHLFLGTKQDNMDDMFAKGRSCRGRKPSAKLSESKVREIRALRGLESQTKIAKRYGIASGTVSLIQTSKIYGWVT